MSFTQVGPHQLPLGAFNIFSRLHREGALDDGAIQDPRMLRELVIAGIVRRDHSKAMPIRLSESGITLAKEHFRPKTVSAAAGITTGE